MSKLELESTGGFVGSSHSDGIALAKNILIARLRLCEPKAHRLLQQQSQVRRVKKSALDHQVIEAERDGSSFEDLSAILNEAFDIASLSEELRRVAATLLSESRHEHERTRDRAVTLRSLAERLQYLARRGERSPCNSKT